MLRFTQRFGWRLANRVGHELCQQQRSGLLSGLLLQQRQLHIVSPAPHQYLQLSDTTVERLHSELNEHSTLVDKMENDFSSLTIKDHKRFGQLEDIVAQHREWKNASEQLEQAQEMVDELGELSGELSSEDAELLEMANEEINDARETMSTVESKLWEMLLPRDEADANNVVLETKAGVGGTEASLFAEEIFDMYRGFAERQGFKFEVIERSKRSEGGLRSATAAVQALPGATIGPLRV